MHVGSVCALIKALDVNPYKYRNLYYKTYSERVLKMINICILNNNSMHDKYAIYRLLYTKIDDKQNELVNY